ncbi:sulfite exporter TauE/SafE family protein [Hydrogenophaga sp. 2FB]|uniref:sulfite exporter TauE/SafE family protein n=1 Tax=Hydrogenophaga sp. 2FB TaxID=2502187 RepID=UPI0010F789CE|nr:sulfite exporter TauE/SafE family protein [Hydrogenophaga sp. 2FB]
MSGDSLPLVLATIAVAYAVFGTTGFGAAMVAVPVLVQVVPLQFAVPLVLLLDIVATTTVVLRNPRGVSLAELGRLLPFMLVGVAIGTTVLSSVSSGWLLIGLGTFVLFAIGRAWASSQRELDALPPIWAAPAGLVGGVFSALFGTGGPIYTTYLVRRLVNPEVFRTTIATVIFCSALVRAAVFATAGLLQQERLLTTALWALPFCILGLAVGSFLRHKLTPRSTRQALFLFMAAGAVGAIYRGAIS